MHRVYCRASGKADVATPSQANPAAAESGVSQEISPRDGMFAGNREHYFGVGRSALFQTIPAAAMPLDICTRLSNPRRSFQGPVQP